MAATDKQEIREDLVHFFEESFRSIEASRLGEAILALCSPSAEKAASAPATTEKRHD